MPDEPNNTPEEKVTTPPPPEERPKVPDVPKVEEPTSFEEPSEDTPTKEPPVEKKVEFKNFSEFPGEKRPKVVPTLKRFGCGPLEELMAKLTKRGFPLHSEECLNY